MNQHNLIRTKAFFRLEVQNKNQKGFIFSLRTIFLLNEAFSFYSFKISRLLGKGKLNLRTKKAFLKSLRTFWFLM